MPITVCRISDHGRLRLVVRNPAGPGLRQRLGQGAHRLREPPSGCAVAAGRCPGRCIPAMCRGGGGRRPGAGTRDSDGHVQVQRLLGRSTSALTVKGHQLPGRAAGSAGLYYLAGLSYFGHPIRVSGASATQAGRPGGQSRWRAASAAGTASESESESSTAGGPGPRLRRSRPPAEPSGPGAASGRASVTQHFRLALRLGTGCPAAQACRAHWQARDRRRPGRREPGRGF